jgi:sn-glycerol 3-phosphate transport system ATP-binding protein
MASDAAVPAGMITLGIRPEDLHLTTDVPGNEIFTASVKVAAVELVGAESYVHGTLADGSDIVFRVAGRSRIEMDDMVEIGAKASDLHFFGSDGARLN